MNLLESDSGGLILDIFKHILNFLAKGFLETNIPNLYNKAKGVTTLKFFGQVHVTSVIKMGSIA